MEPQINQKVTKSQFVVMALAKDENFLTKCKISKKKWVFGTSTLSVGNSNSKQEFFFPIEVKSYDPQH